VKSKAEANEMKANISLKQLLDELEDEDIDLDRILIEMDGISILEDNYVFESDQNEPEDQEEA
jgi:hypothetical protein